MSNENRSMLLAKKRALEISIKKDTRRLAHKAAKLLGEIEALDGSALTHRQLSKLEKSSGPARTFLRQHLGTLADRLDDAKAGAFLEGIFDSPIILRTAYFRDRVISLLLAYAESRARRANNHARQTLLMMFFSKI